MRRSLLALCCLILLVGVLPLGTTSVQPSAPKPLSGQQPTSQLLATDVPPTPDPTTSAPTTLPLPQVSTTILPSNHTNTDYVWMVANRRYRAYFVNTLLTSDTLLFVNHNGFTYSEALQEWDWTNLIQETDYLNPATGASVAKNSTAVTYTNALTDGSGSFVSFSYTPGQDGVRGTYSLLKLPRPPATSVSGAVFLAFYFTYKISAGLTAYTGAGQPLTNPMTTNQSIYFVNSTKGVPGIGIDQTWKPLAEFYLPPPTATDGKGATVLGYYLLRQSGKTLWIGKLIPYTWLQKAIYPVMVDPTVFDTTTSNYVFYTPPHAIWSGPAYHTAVYFDGTNLVCTRFNISDIATYTTYTVTAGTCYSASLIGYPGNNTILCVYITSGGVTAVKSSTNGGATWSAAKAVEASGGYYPTGGIQWAWSGTYVGRVFLGIRIPTYYPKVYYTDNWQTASPTWTKVAICADGGANDSELCDLLWIYSGILLGSVVEFQSAGKTGYIFRSTNGGGAWAKVFTLGWSGIDFSWSGHLGASMDNTLSYAHNDYVTWWLQNQANYDALYFGDSKTAGSTWADTDYRIDQNYGRKSYPPSMFGQFEAADGGVWTDLFGLHALASGNTYLSLVQRGTGDTEGWADPLTGTVLTTPTYNAGDNIGPYLQAPQQVNVAGKILVVYLEKTASPFDVTAIEATYAGYNYAPSTDAVACTNDDSSKVYPRYKVYTFTANVSDANGYADIYYVALSLQAGPLWSVRYCENNNSFYESSGNHNYIELLTSSAVRSGNYVNCTITLKIEWAHPQSGGTYIALNAVDGYGNNAATKNGETIECEPRLDISASTVNDGTGTPNRGGFDAAYTMTGHIHWYGTTIHPDDNGLDVVDIWTSSSGYGSHVGPWNATSLTAGNFTMTCYSDDAVGLNTLTIKVVANAEGSSAADRCHTSHTNTYITDRIAVTVSHGTAYKLQPGTNCTLTVSAAIYEYDSASAIAHIATYTWNDTTFNHAVAGYYGYHVTAITTDTLHGIATMTSTAAQVLWESVTCNPLTIQWLEVSETNWWAQVQVTNLKWSVEGTTVPNYALVRLYANGTLVDSKLVYGGAVADLMAQFTGGWYYVLFHLQIDYATAPYSFSSYEFHSEGAVVPITHTLYPDVGIAFTDIYLYVTFSSNWHNASLYLWDNVSTLLGSSMTEGITQIVLPTAIGLHRFDILINGSSPHAGTNTGAYPANYAWKWFHCNYTVSVTGAWSIVASFSYSDVWGNCFVQSNYAASYVIYENDTSSASGSIAAYGATIRWQLKTTIGTWCVGIRLTYGATTKWANSSYTISAPVGFDVRLEGQWSFIGAQGSVFVVPNRVCAYTVYENDTSCGSGAAIPAGTSITWVHDATPGLFLRVGLRFVNGSTVLWRNMTTSNAATHPLAISVWSFSQDAWYIHLTVYTNWLNTSVTIMDSYYDGVSWKNTVKFAGQPEGTFDYDVHQESGNHTIYVTCDGGVASISQTAAYKWQRDYPNYEPPAVVDYRWILGFVILLSVCGLAGLGAIYRKSGRGLPAETYTPPTGQQQMTPEKQFDALTAAADEPAKQRVWEEYCIECHEAGRPPTKTRDEVWKEYLRGKRR